MSGPYFFGSGNGSVPRETAEKIQAIAEERGADFVAVSIPGNGPRYWFEAPNRGAPFDGETQREVMAAVEAAGLWPPVGRLSPGESAHVQFRCARSTQLAVLSRAQSEGLTEREAWELAGREWADR